MPPPPLARSAFSGVQHVYLMCMHVYFTCIHVKYTCYTPGNGLIVFATPKNPHFDPSLTSE